MDLAIVNIQHDETRLSVRSGSSDEDAAVTTGSPKREPILRQTSKALNIFSASFKESTRYISGKTSSTQVVPPQEKMWKGYPIKWLVQEIKYKRENELPIKFDGIGYNGCSFAKVMGTMTEHKKELT